ncbi:hypothetical protein EUA93_16050 [Nocardioides oleivorans]|uniref:Uncharacterized protein n=1 Tax=Nocardioides oleivorans TaxID=273676 RepID=A0A4Q2RV10_9ACTN|nr:hypothetical protein [Nocardioides oleivorans]RYB91669.1 hypothetical protein EUA93_16050 [Nocardioides oleivorans]
MTQLRAVALARSFDPTPARSSSELLARQVLDPSRDDVTSEVVLVVAHDVRPGVDLDVGECDQWPAIRQRITDAAEPHEEGHP